MRLPRLLVAAMIIGAPSLLPGIVGAWQAAPGASPSAQPAHAGAPYAPRPGRTPPGVDQLTAIGRAMFFDKTLSANGRIACASCHDPASAFGPSNGAAVQPGMRASARGFRSTPSLRYLHSLPPFSEHHFDNEGDDSVDLGPTGGHTWDGRAGSVHEQARLPLLAADEMGNANEQAVVRKLERTPYAAQMRAAFGADLFADAAQAFAAATMALEVFQQSPSEFYPYSSRYDAVLRGQATLTPREARGLALFNDPAKGNCASCHLSTPTPDGAFPLFTDFGHIALGVPRNEGLRANDDPRFFDLGLCGPLRRDFAIRPGAPDPNGYCGRFRTPSLRNVALRKVFFHNGVIRSLDEAVRFYATRDTDPRHWYSRDARGNAKRYDDLPRRYHANVNTEPPFGGKAGSTPALNEAEIGDIVAFLKTLTDADLDAGQQPSH
jgi:cytochrome c peroxidase